MSERSEGGERGGGLGLGLEGAGAIVIQRRVVFSQKFGSFPDALPLAIGVEIAVEVVIRNPSNLTGKLPLLPLSPVIQPSTVCRAGKCYYGRYVQMGKINVDLLEPSKKFHPRPIA